MSKLVIRLDARAAEMVFRCVAAERQDAEAWARTGPENAPGAAERVTLCREVEDEIKRAIREGR